MKKITKLLALVSLSLLSFASTAQLVVTNGKIMPLAIYEVETPSSRADVLDHSPNNLELTVKYLGPTTIKSPNADGSVQEQVGMKLRSQDGCNVVYVMRRINPNSSISVSIKSNPGVSTTCGDKGYLMVKSIPVLPPALNSTFVIGAVFDKEDEIMTLKLDGKVLWVGDVPSVNKGTAGIRTDNAKIQFSFK